MGSVGQRKGRVGLCGSVCDMSVNVCWCIHDLYLDIQAIKSLGTNNLLQDSDPLSLLVLPAAGERSEPTPAFIPSLGVLQEDGERQHLPALPERDPEQVLWGWGGDREGWDMGHHARLTCASLETPVGNRVGCKQGGRSS